MHRTATAAVLTVVLLSIGIWSGPARADDKQTIKELEQRVKSLEQKLEKLTKDFDELKKGKVEKAKDEKKDETVKPVKPVSVQGVEFTVVAVRKGNLVALTYVGVNTTESDVVMKFHSLEGVDEEGNSISEKFSKAGTFRFVPGVKTRVVVVTRELPKNAKKMPALSLLNEAGYRVTLKDVPITE